MPKCPFSRIKPYNYYLDIVLNGLIFQFDKKSKPHHFRRLDRRMSEKKKIKINVDSEEESADAKTEAAAQKNKESSDITEEKPGENTLDDPIKEVGTQWLQEIVDHTSEGSLRIVSL